jgi:xyloglucan-specific endo-beta-1,4-glucanase
MKVTTGVSYAILLAGVLGKEDVKRICGNQRFGELNDSLSCTFNLTLRLWKHR